MKFFVTILVLFTALLGYAQPAQTKTKPIDVVTSNETTKKELAFVKRKSAFEVPKKVVAEEKIDPNKIWDNPEVQIEYATGNDAFINFVRKELNPNVPVNNYAPVGLYSIKVKVQVNIDGKIAAYIPLTNLGYGMEKEGIRLLKQTDKKWKPALVKNKPVISTKVFTFTFEIRE